MELVQYRVTGGFEGLHVVNRIEQVVRQIEFEKSVLSDYANGGLYHLLDAVKGKK